MTIDPDKLAKLRAENGRLVALLDAHGIEWRVAEIAPVAPELSPLSTEQRLALFRSSHHLGKKGHQK